MIVSNCKLATVLAFFYVLVNSFEILWNTYPLELFRILYGFLANLKDSFDTVGGRIVDNK